MGYNKLTKYTEKPEIMDLQEALGVPETGIMDEQTTQALMMQIQESGFAESKYFTEKLEEEDVKTTEEAEALLFEIASEAILKEHYKCELEKIQKFMKECYESKMKEQGIEVVSMEYDPEHHGSKEYQQIFEKGGRIFKFGGKQYLNYNVGGSVTLTAPELRKKLLEQNYDADYVNKMTQGFTDDTKIRINRGEDNSINYDVLGPTQSRGFGRTSDASGIKTGEKSTGFLKGIFGQKKSGTKGRRLNFSKALYGLAQGLDYDSNKEPEVECTGPVTDKNGVEFDCINGKLVKKEVAPVPENTNTNTNTDETPQPDSSNTNSNQKTSDYKHEETPIAENNSLKTETPDYTKMSDGELQELGKTDPNALSYLKDRTEQFGKIQTPTPVAMRGRIKDPAAEQAAYEAKKDNFDEYMQKEVEPSKIISNKNYDLADSRQLFYESLNNMTVDNLKSEKEKLDKELKFAETQNLNIVDPIEKKKLANKIQDLKLKKERVEREMTREPFKEEKSFFDFMMNPYEYLKNTKKQGGTMFSKFNKGGKIEIKEKDLATALKNVIGTSKKKRLPYS